MTDYEFKLLRHVGGEQIEELRSGAAMWAALDFLREDGYVTGGPIVKLTDKGKEYLNANRSPGKGQQSP